MIYLSLASNLESYAYILIIIFAIFYFYFLVLSLKQARKVGISIFLVIAFALCFSPFIAYAFTMSTTKFSDKIKAEYYNNKGEKINSNLTEIIKNKITVSNIVSIEENKSCYYCNESYIENETVCKSCGKKRPVYHILAKADNMKQYVELDKWQNLHPNYKIISIKK